MPLSDDQLQRYARHIVLPEVGGAGQQTLLNSKVLVVGAGGLGAPVILYLAAAGVGTIGIVDDDTVSISNLQRQVIHTTAAIGQAKTDSAAETVQRLDPSIRIVPHTCRLTADNAAEIISAYDLVADGCDNFQTRFLVNDACFFEKKPLVSAAVGRFDGQLTTFRAFEDGPDGRPNPSYRCLVPEAPPEGMVAPCAEAGILGAITGVMGSLQALEAIKELLGIGESLAGRLLIYDGLDTRFRIVKLPWDPASPLNGEAPTIRDLSIHSPAPLEAADDVPQLGALPYGVGCLDRPSAYGIHFSPKDGRLLTVETEGKIVLPGGGIDEGETAPDAVARELLEETGFQAKKLEELCRIDEFVQRVTRGDWVNKIGTFFTIDQLKGDGVPREANHKVLWLKPSKALEKLTRLAHREAVEKALAARD